MRIINIMYGLMQYTSQQYIVIQKYDQCKSSLIPSIFQLIMKEYLFTNIFQFFGSNCVVESNKDKQQLMFKGKKIAQLMQNSQQLTLAKQILVDVLEKRKMTQQCHQFLKKHCPERLQKLVRCPSIYMQWEEVNKSQEMFKKELQQIKLHKQFIISQNKCHFQNLDSIQQPISIEDFQEKQNSTHLAKKIWNLQKQFWRIKEINYLLTQIISSQKKPIFSDLMKKILKKNDIEMIESHWKQKTLNTQKNLVDPKRQEQVFKSIIERYFNQILSNQELTINLQGVYPYQLREQMRAVQIKIKKKESQALKFIKQIMFNKYKDLSYLSSFILQIENKQIKQLSQQQLKQVFPLWQNFKLRVYFQELILELAEERFDLKKINKIKESINYNWQSSPLKQNFSVLIQRCKDQYYLKEMFNTGCLITMEKYGEDFFIGLSKDWQSLWLTNFSICQKLHSSMEEFLKEFYRLNIKYSIINENNEVSSSSDINNAFKSLRLFIQNNFRPHHHLQQRISPLQMDHIGQWKEDTPPKTLSDPTQQPTTKTVQKRISISHQFSLSSPPHNTQHTPISSHSSHQLPLLRQQKQQLQDILSLYQQLCSKHFPRVSSQQTPYQTHKRLLALLQQRLESSDKQHSSNKQPIAEICFFTLLTGDVFEREDAQEKRLLIEGFQSEVRRRIGWTKLLFRGEMKKKTNFHEYVDYKPNIMLLMRTVNERYILGFTAGQLSPNEKNTEFTIIMGCVNGEVKAYHLKKSSSILATKYDDSFFMMGNSDLRVRPNEGVLFSNLELSSSCFQTGHFTINDLLGMGAEKEVQVKQLQFHQISFLQ